MAFAFGLMIRIVFFFSLLPSYLYFNVLCAIQQVCSFLSMMSPLCASQLGLFTLGQLCIIFLGAIGFSY
jgi:hypothetical protein